MRKLTSDDIIFENQNYVVNQDWEVPIPGFFIVAPKKKIRSITEFSEEEAREFIGIVKRVRQGMDAIGIKDVYLFQNEDSEHGFHLWMFPRYDWMERFGRKIQSVRPIMEYAQKELTSESAKEEVYQTVKKMKSVLEKKK